MRLVVAASAQMILMLGMPRTALNGRQEAASASIPASKKARAGLPPCLKRKMSWRNGPWYWPCSASPCQGGGEARQSPHSSGCPAAGQGRGSPQARQRPPTYGPRARAQAGQRPWASIPASGPEPPAPSSSTGVPQTGQRCSLKPSRRGQAEQEGQAPQRRLREQEACPGPSP